MQVTLLLLRSLGRVCCEALEVGADRSGHMLEPPVITIKRARKLFQLGACLASTPNHLCELRFAMRFHQSWTELHCGTFAHAPFCPWHFIQSAQQVTARSCFCERAPIQNSQLFARLLSLAISQANDTFAAHCDRLEFCAFIVRVREIPEEHGREQVAICIISWAAALHGQKFHDGFRIYARPFCAHWWQGCSFIGAP